MCVPGEEMALGCTMKVRSIEAPPLTLENVKDMLQPSWCQIPEEVLWDPCLNGLELFWQQRATNTVKSNA